MDNRGHSAGDGDWDGRKGVPQNEKLTTLVNETIFIWVDKLFQVCAIKYEREREVQL